MKSVSQRLLLGAVASIAMWSAMGPLTYADILPYSVDANTTGLWHLNETEGPTLADSSSSAFDLTMSGGASLGASSLSGFGNALSTDGVDGVARGAGNTVDTANLFGAGGGAFSIDMLIKVNSLSESAVFFAIESTTGNSTTRLMHLWYDAGNFELGVFGGGNHVIPLPTDGPNAINATDWFHIAVTYTGDVDAEDNITVYWTKADPNNTVASVLDTITVDVPFNDRISTNINLGRDGRNVTDFSGSIDEVRISNIARGPDEFIFAVPEPSSFVLVGIGLAAIGAVRLRRKAA